MKQAIVPLLIFFILIAGGSFLYAHWHFFQEDSATFVHDKPIPCLQCNALMWHGGREHVCRD